jgi:hypothetical protein
MASSKTRRKTTTAASTRITSKDNRAGSRPKAVPDGQANRVKQSSITGRGAKPGSKQAVLVERLCRPSGAGIGDLVKTLGWLPEAYESGRNYKTEWRRERTPVPTFSGEVAGFRHFHVGLRKLSVSTQSATRYECRLWRRMDLPTALAEVCLSV